MQIDVSFCAACCVVASIRFSARCGPAPGVIPCCEIAGVYAGARKSTAIHDQPFKFDCQWVLLGFHRFFAGFFGFCVIWGTNRGIYRLFCVLPDPIGAFKKCTRGAARAKRAVICLTSEGSVAVSAGSVAETPHCW